MNSNWMGGYVADVAYTLGFYRELAPTFLNFACIINGVAAPEPEKPFRYCELGCGRGFGTVLLAAANPNSQFVGIDFNPSHIAEARSLAKSAGISNVTFLEMSFGDAAKSTRAELVDFDVVTLHGVYSWILPEVKQQILDFVREKLVSGGVLFVSYNCMPGWAAAGPMQRLLKEVGDRSTKQSVAAIDEGMSLLKKLVEHSSAFIAHNPSTKSRIERLEKQDKVYLAHEFLNAGWNPIYVTDAMADFASAKATYIGSASIAENRPELCVQRDLIPVVRSAPDLGLQELLKDYAVNKQFRRDIYIKGPQRLNAREQRKRVGETFYVRTQLSEKLPEAFKLPIGEVKTKPEAIAALTKILGPKPLTGDTIITALTESGLNETDAILYLLLLVNSGVILPARKDFETVDRGPAKQLNAIIMEMSAAVDSHRFLASPVLGSAIGAGFVDRLFSPEIAASPKADDTKIAGLTFDRLTKAGQSFRREGKPIEKNDKSVAEIGKAVGEFRQQRLPYWQQLGLL